MKTFVLALDQGTTSSRAVVFDAGGQPVASTQKEFRQIYPKPGWVEHDPEDIWSTQAGVAMEARDGSARFALPGSGRQPRKNASHPGDQKM